MDGSAFPAAIRTTCPYCGVGCGVLATPQPDGTVAISGDTAHPANFGRLCSKGAALGETLSLEGRLLHPEIDGRPVHWSQALDAVADGFARTVRDHGPDAVAFYVSGQLLTEDYYVANKLIKGFLGTANIDTNSRLCMASSVAGHRRAFGSDTVPGNYEDLDLAELVVLGGSNLAWCHPVLFQRIVAAHRARPEMKIVVIDPRRTTTAEEADLHLPLRPGSDVALFNGLLAHLQQAGVRNPRFLDRYTVGEGPALTAAASAGSIAAVADACDLPAADVEAFFRLFVARERVVTVYSQGINQSSSGTDKVNSIINCHLFTGRIGRPGMGPFSITGQPNAMGGREVGALANQLAAHMDFSPTDLDRVRRFWRAPNLATRPGLKAVDLFRAIGSGRIKAVWIMATNPVVSLPESDGVRAALESCPLVVVSDGSRANETARYADILLPTLLWSERDGTVTNSERRVSRQRPFRPPPGEAKADWWILSQVAARLGFGDAFAYRNAAQIFREHASLSAFENSGQRDFDLGGIATLDDGAYRQLPPTQWPVRADDGNPVERLFGDGRFFTADGRAALVAVVARPPTHAPDPAFPLILNTGRVRDQWHTMTRTAIPRLMEHTPEPFVAVHPEDAASLGLADGTLAHVDSRWGSATLRVRLSPIQRRGEIFVPMHWSWPLAAASAANRAVNPATDPLSGQPELKHTPVRLTPFRATWHGTIMSRTPLEIGTLSYSVAIPGADHWAYEIAGTEPPAEAWERLASRIGQGGSDRVDVEDAARGRYRVAWFSAGRLEACLLLDRQGDLPPRKLLAGFFGSHDRSLVDRGALLAGRAVGAVRDEGPTICVCHGVCRSRIDAAIVNGDTTVEALGRSLKAGTNCGSCIPELRQLLWLIRKSSG